MTTRPRPWPGLLLLATVGTATALALGILGLPADEGESADFELATATTPTQHEFVVNVTVPLPGSATAASSPETATAGSDETSGHATEAVVKAATGASSSHSSQGEETFLVPTTAPDPATTPGATTYEYFTFPGVATEIIVAVHEGMRLEFWSASPEEGWTFYVEHATGHEVEIEFESATMEAEFTLRLVDGGLLVSTEIEAEDDGHDSGHDERESGHDEHEDGDHDEDEQDEEDEHDEQDEQDDEDQHDEEEDDD